MKLFENTDFKGKVTSFESFRTSFTRDKIPERYKEQIRERADRAANTPVPLLSAHDYRDFVRNGNRTRYEKPYFVRRVSLLELIIGEFTFDDGRYLDALIDYLWAICEETSWVLPAHNNQNLEQDHHLHSHIKNITHQLPFEYEADDVYFIDLFSAQTGAEVALAWYLLGDKLEEACPDTVVRRMERELKREILTPFEKYYESYWWGGIAKAYVNNWSPWILSNILTVIALFEQDAAKRELLTERCCHMIDTYISLIPKDGSCDEGASYWNVSIGAVFTFLEVLNDITADKVTVSENEILRKAGEYIVHMHIAGANESVTFNDCARYMGRDYAMIYRYGEYMNDPLLSDFAGQYGFTQSLQINDSLPYLTMNGCATDIPYREFTHKKCYYMDVIKIMTARCVHNGENIFVCAKAGKNNEGHGHIDAGSFVLYLNDSPLFLDVGVRAYTKDTFNENRFKAWEMRSPYHNTCGVDDIEQKWGAAFGATDVVCENSVLRFECKNALADAGGIRTLYRELNVADGFKIVDTYAFDDTRTYRFYLITAQKPLSLTDGEIVFGTPDGKQHTFAFPAGSVVETEVIPFEEDNRLFTAWKNDAFYRLSFSQTAKNGVFEFRLK